MRLKKANDALLFTFLGIRIIIYYYLKKWKKLCGTHCGTRVPRLFEKLFRPGSAFRGNSKILFRPSSAFRRNSKILFRPSSAFRGTFKILFRPVPVPRNWNTEQQSSAEHGTIMPIPAFQFKQQCFNTSFEFFELEKFSFACNYIL